jgi:thymidylate synthase ThyX
MPQTINTMTSITPEPSVRLVNAFSDPTAGAIAAARTCYSSKVISTEDVMATAESKSRGMAIAKSTFGAGHHTVFQHAHFTFVLDKISRQFIWSFLHAHPFYNSEQVSQRYVEVQPENFLTPSIEGKALDIYTETVRHLMETYHRLMDVLIPFVEKEYTRIFPLRKTEEKKWRSAIKKRAQEVARYILPVSTHAHLYHTISGITLHRYHRLCQVLDVPEETSIVVRKMVEEVRALDPDFISLAQDPIPLEETPEHEWLLDRCGSSRALGDKKFADEFDRALHAGTNKPSLSRLVTVETTAEKVFAESVRTVLGLTIDKLSDENAIDMVLNPAKNKLLSDTLNLTTHSKLTRTMVHPHFTFQKKLSHTADSQDQRHRTTPGARPILARQFIPGKPDAVRPALLEASPEATRLFETSVNHVWKAIEQLLDMKVKPENALYLLPNAFPIRFYESGDLLSFHHKWTKRLCYTAQEEIWQASLEEVQQVSEAMPLLGKYIRPPCGLRQWASARPFCPEGDRFCGVLVWRLPLEEYRRLI